MPWGAILGDVAPTVGRARRCPGGTLTSVEISKHGTCPCVGSPLVLIPSGRNHDVETDAVDPDGGRPLLCRHRRAAAPGEGRRQVAHRRVGLGLPGLLS